MPKANRKIIERYYSCEMNELLEHIKEPLEEYSDFMNYASKICEERDPVKDIRRVKSAMGLLIIKYGIVKDAYSFLRQNVPVAERLFPDEIAYEIEKMAKDRGLDAYAAAAEKVVRDEAKRKVFSKKDSEEIFEEAKKIIDEGLELVEKIRNSSFLKITNLFLGGVMKALDIPMLKTIPPKEVLEEAKKLGMEYFESEIERLY